VAYLTVPTIFTFIPARIAFAVGLVASGFIIGFLGVVTFGEQNHRQSNEASIILVIG
jgi:hypothetical protein